MDFIRISDIDNERFYKIPKMLFLNPKYKSLSVIAKVVYGMIKDRMEISKRHGWHDLDGRCYVYFKRSELAEFLGLTERTIKTIFADLKAAGLLETKRQGTCQPAKIYLKRVDTSMDEEADFTSEGKNLPQEGEENFPTEVKQISRPWGSRFPSNETERNETEKRETDRRNSCGVSDRVPYQKVVDMYHEICTSLPKVKTLSEARKKAIKARWNEWGKSMDTLRECFMKVEASDFLTGRAKEWTAGFDWIMKPSNFTKIMEGNYDNKGTCRQETETSSQGKKPPKLGIAWVEPFEP